MNPAIIGKALKARKLWQSVPEPLKISQGVMKQDDGTAIFFFQALMPSTEAAEMLDELSSLSEEIEKVMKS